MRAISIAPKQSIQKLVKGKKKQAAAKQQETKTQQTMLEDSELPATPERPL